MHYETGGESQYPKMFLEELVMFVFKTGLKVNTHPKVQGSSPAMINFKKELD